mgnify:CR=1 FL=1
MVKRRGATIAEGDFAALLESVRSNKSKTGFKNVKRTTSGKFQAIVYCRKIGGQLSLGSFDEVEQAALVVAEHNRAPTELKIPTPRAKRRDVRAQLPSPSSRTLSVLVRRRRNLLRARPSRRKRPSPKRTRSTKQSVTFNNKSGPECLLKTFARTSRQPSETR